MYAGVEALLEIIQMACPTAYSDAVDFLREQIEVHRPAGEDPAPEAFAEFQARKKSAAKRKTEGNGSDDDREEGTSRKRRRLHKKRDEDEMEVDTDVPVRARLASRISIPEVVVTQTEWPVGLRLTSSPLSEIEGLAGPSGLSTEEKEKTPGEMEIEDVAGPSGDPAGNAKPVEAPVKVEEVPVDINRVRYKVVEVPPKEPAQPVIEGAPADEETQPVATEAEDEAVEVKTEPVLLALPPPTVELTNKQMTELRITTRKNDAGKEVIEILDSDDEMPAEEEGKEKEPDEEPEAEPDAKDRDEKAPDS
jgi:hypothetical protein